jgi:Coenzyme PQQ synthesis protein D (PqqD)
MASTGPRLRLRNTDWRNIDGEAIVLDPTSERYLSLNRSGTLMWERLIPGTTRAELVAALVEAFEVDEDQARTDVDAFLEALRREKLLIDSPQ